jgi:hypothetical protein
MKQIINIVTFFSILAIPFALSSQTRKAIPAGRYEALSGVKNSRSVKSLDSSGDEKKDSVGLFWNEVLKHVPEKSKELTYFTKGKLDQSSDNVLNNRGLKAVSSLTAKTNIVFSDDLKRDITFLNELKNKKSLIILKETQELKDVMPVLARFDVLVYQSEEKAHYYLLQLK